MIGIDFNPVRPKLPNPREKLNPEYLWWVSEANWNKIFDDCVARGYISRDLLELKDEATMYDSLTASGGSLRLLSGLAKRAGELIPEFELIQTPDAFEVAYLVQLRELLEIWDKLSGNEKIENLP